LVVLAAEAVGERGGGGLVQDAQDLETCDAPRDLGGRALELVEVRGDGDDRLVDRGAERALGDLLRLLEDERADLRERVLLAAREDERPLARALAHVEGEALARLDELLGVPRSADEALDARDRVLAVDPEARLGVAADEDLAAGMEAHHAREKPVAVLV